MVKTKWPFRSRAIGLIRSGFLYLGIALGRRTKTADLLNFLRRLRPQDCGKALIRIGEERDGGYLIPDDLEGIEYCFSPGVNTLAGFESQLANLGIKCYLADYSVDKPPITRPEFTFDKMFIGSSDREHFITLASWKDRYLRGYTGDLILQMDIEGCEYEAILNTPDALLNQFRIMVIEFHNLDYLFDAFVFSLFSSTFDKILQNFYVAHIHPNNYGGNIKMGGLEIPKTMEITFINKKRAHSTTPRTAFPHKCDADNSELAPPMSLPKCWYAAD